VITPAVVEHRPTDEMRVAPTMSLGSCARIPCVAALDDVDLTKRLSGSEGLKRLQAAQRRLLALRLQAGGLIGDGSLGPPLAVVFEGWDASGKGGAIRRLTGPLDPRHVRVAEFAAPGDRELRHDFLWRFWPALPGWGGNDGL
jgi:polyphosphate kinase 2 (PPK2 family)